MSVHLRVCMLRSIDINLLDSAFCSRHLQGPFTVWGYFVLDCNKDSSYLTAVLFHVFFT
jgi:hypothetical protein